MDSEMIMDTDFVDEFLLAAEKKIGNALPQCAT